MKPRYHPTAFCLAFCLTACSGGGGRAPAPTGNLSAGSVRMVSTEPNAGHEMEVATTLTATEEFTDVPVSYVLLNKADVDSEAEDVRQHVIGTSVFGTVPPGVSEFRSVVRIPETVREDVDWYLVANVDPANAIRETDEDDNMPTADSRLEVRVDNANTDLADLVIEGVDVDADAAILYPIEMKQNVGNVEDVEDHDFSATMMLSTTGARPLEGVDISASITIPGGATFPLLVWDEANDRYVSQIFTDVAPDIFNTVHLDLQIPDTGARRAVDAYLRANGSAAFPVTIGSNKTAGIAEWENGVQRHAGRSTSDNIISDEIVIALPPSPEPQCDDLVWNNRLRKDWNANVFGIGVDLDSGASLDGRGAMARANAKIPVTLFGSRSDAVDLRASGRVTPVENGPSSSQFNLDLELFGVSVFSRSSTDPTLALEETMSFTRSRELRHRFFVGPIPVELRAVGSGELGFNAGITLDPARLEVRGTAFGRIQGIAEAAVSIIIVRAGVGGSITLIDNSFTARGSCALGTPAGGRVSGTLKFDVTNDLRGPSGRLFLFEEHPEIVWCWAIFPCGFRQVRNEHTVASFRTFRKRDVLFNAMRTATICLNQ